MRVAEYELASDDQRLVADDRLFLLQYWLVREQLGDGVETHFVRCCQRELRSGHVIGGAAEVAGLGADAGAARRIYGMVVAAGALPVHLHDVVQEARHEYAAACAPGWRPRRLGPDATEPSVLPPRDGDAPPLA